MFLLGVIIVGGVWGRVLGRLRCDIYICGLGRYFFYKFIFVVRGFSRYGLVIGGSLSIK